MGLKTSRAGPFAIPVRIVIHAKRLLAIPIFHLINESFKFAIFPNILKLAITPIYNSNDSKIVSNYKPISILHWLSKVFEMAVALCMTGFANKFSLLSSRQSVWLQTW